MNILLLDDDAVVIEALRTSIDWAAIGIDNVYYAYSVKQAKRIIEDVTIHVLVSDIEMPKENAFVLLEWIKDKGLILQEILLTMYADFQYASQAIKYNCFEYALKPVDYGKLEQMIKCALEKEKEELKKVDNQQICELWRSSIQQRKEGYLADLLWNLETVDGKNYGLEYSDQDQFILVIIRNLEEFLGDNSDANSGMDEWIIKNLIRESVRGEGLSLDLVRRKKTGIYYCIIHCVNASDDIGQIREGLRKYIHRVKQKRNISSCAFMGKAVTINELREHSCAFAKYIRHTIIDPNEIREVEDLTIGHTQYCPPDFLKLEKYILDQQSEMVKTEIAIYMEQIKESKNISYAKLDRLMYEFEQMLYMTLKEKGIVVFGMDNPIFSDELRRKGRLTLSWAKCSMEKMIDLVIAMVIDGTEDKTIVDTVVEYMHKNIENEMTRNSLANMVYLNPDYLAKIFKKKMGTSISNYILEKRMTMAKEYIEHSLEPINTVAVKCGYDNFSYFTKVFKLNTGFTPKEYRKEFGRKR